MSAEPENAKSETAITMDMDTELESANENQKRGAETMDVESENIIGGDKKKLKKEPTSDVEMPDKDAEAEPKTKAQTDNGMGAGEGVKHKKIQEKEVKSDAKGKEGVGSKAKSSSKKPKKDIQDKILAFLAQELQVGRKEIPKDEIAQGCGYQLARAHAFFYSFQDLQKNQGLVAKSSTKACYELTEKGKTKIPKDAVLEVSAKQTNAQKQEALQKIVLKGCEEAKQDKLEIIFGILKDGKPHSLNEFIEKTGYKNLKSKGLGYTLRDMIKKWKIVEKPTKDTWKFTDMCFPEGRPE